MGGWQFRQAKSLFGGLVRLTATRNGLSTSVGLPGLRHSRSAKGRITRTVSIPGTGLCKRLR